MLGVIRTLRDLIAQIIIQSKLGLRFIRFGTRGLAFLYAVGSLLLPPGPPRPPRPPSVRAPPPGPLPPTLPPGYTGTPTRRSAARLCGFPMPLTGRRASWKPPWGAQFPPCPCSPDRSPIQPLPCMREPAEQHSRSADVWASNRALPLDLRRCCRVYIPGG